MNPATTHRRGTWCAFGLATLIILNGMDQASAQELTVTPEKGSPQVGRPFRVQCDVSWSGDAGAYSVRPAETSAFDWGTVTDGPSEATVKDGMNVVSQTLTITPSKAGTFQLPEINVALQGPETPPVSATTESPTHPSEPSVPQTLTSHPLSVTVTPPDRIFAWVVGILGALPLFAAIAWFVRRRHHRPGRSEAVAPATPVAEVESAMHAARQRRIEGDFYGFYRELARAAGALSPYEPELNRVLDDRTRQTGYGGSRPSEDVLDSDFRAVERALQKLREDVCHS